MKIANPEEENAKEPIAPSFDNVADLARRKELAERSHPFVQGLGNAGAMLGRDIGILALRAIESIQAGGGGVHAVLYWKSELIPAAINAQIPEAMLPKVHGAMIIPAHVDMPSFTFADGPVRSASRTLMDGSRLVVFEKAETQDNDAASA